MSTANRPVRRPSLVVPFNPHPARNFRNSMSYRSNTSMPPNFEFRSWSANSLKSSEDERRFNNFRNLRISEILNPPKIITREQNGSRNIPYAKSVQDYQFNPLPNASFGHKHPVNRTPLVKRDSVNVNAPLLTDQPMTNGSTVDEIVAKFTTLTEEKGHTSIHVLPASSNTRSKPQPSNTDVNEFSSFGRSFSRQESPLFVSKSSSVTPSLPIGEYSLDRPHAPINSVFRPVLSSPYRVSYLTKKDSRISRSLPDNGFQSLGNDMKKKSLPRQPSISPSPYLQPLLCHSNELNRKTDLIHGRLEHTLVNGTTHRANTPIGTNNPSSVNKRVSFANNGTLQNGLVASANRTLSNGSTTSQIESYVHDTHGKMEKSQFSDQNEELWLPTGIIPGKRGALPFDRRSRLDNASRLPPLVLAPSVTFVRPNHVYLRSHTNSEEKHKSTLNESSQMTVQTWNEKSLGLLKRNTPVRNVQPDSPNSVSVSFSDSEQFIRSTNINHTEPLQTFMKGFEWSRGSVLSNRLSRQPSQQNPELVNKETSLRSENSDFTKVLVTRRSVSADEAKLTSNIDCPTASNTTVYPSALKNNNSHEHRRQNRERYFRGFNQVQNSSIGSRNTTTFLNTHPLERKPQHVVFDLSSNEYIHYLAAENSPQLGIARRVENDSQLKVNTTGGITRSKRDMDPLAVVSNREAKSEEILSNDNTPTEPKLVFKQNKLKSFRRQPKQSKRINWSFNKFTEANSNKQTQRKSPSPQVDQMMTGSFVQEIHPTKYSTPVDVLKQPISEQNGSMG